MALSQALALAQEKGLDLVEIAPNATPPVAKIISYDKFRYQQKKEGKKRSHNPTEELKQIRITARSAENDLRVRLHQLEEFLKRGNKVEIMLVLRGREKYNQDWARKKFGEFLKMITAPYQVTMTQRPGGKGIVMQIMKK